MNMPMHEMITHAVGVWFTVWLLLLLWAGGG